MSRSNGLSWIGALVLGASLFGVACLGATALVAADDVSFKNQLAPILARRCLGCHDNRKSEGRYALHTFEQMLKAGDGGERPIVPGKPEESYLWRKLIESDASLRMPQEDDPLSPAELALFKAWIEQGAKFDGPAPSDRLATLLPPRAHPAAPAHYRRAAPTFAVRFAPDGRTLFTGGVHEVLQWDATTGRLLRRLAGMPQRIHSLRFSPEGRTLAVAGGAPGEYGEIRLVELSDASVRTLPAWEDVVLDVAFSRDGAKLVAGGADNSVRGYDLATGRELWRTQQHVDWVTALDVTDYAFAESIVPNEGAPAGFSFSEHEQASGAHPQQHWAFPGDHYVVRKANWELEAHGGQVDSLTKITITGIGKTYQEKRERLTGEALAGHGAVVETLRALHDSWGRVAPAAPWVVTASRDRTVKVFSLETGALFTTYKGHRREYGPLAGLHRVFGVQAEPGVRRIWSGGEGRHFHGWNPLTVRDEDGTAADMEARFAKEYSIDLVKHDQPQGVMAMVRAGTQLFATTPRGEACEFTIAGPGARYGLGDKAPAVMYAGLSDPLFAVDAHAAAGLVAAGGFTGDVAVWKLGQSEPVVKFRASP